MAFYTLGLTFELVILLTVIVLAVWIYGIYLTLRNGASDPPATTTRCAEASGYSLPPGFMRHLRTAFGYF